MDTDQPEDGHPRRRQRRKADFRFNDARLCFGFAGTLADRGSKHPFERLVRPSDLARWCVESGCLAIPPDCTDTDLNRARDLREAIQRVGEALAGRGAADAGDIAVINRAAARPPLAPELSPDGSAVRWHGQDIDAVLSHVARDLLAICDSPLRDRVHLCENPTCGVPFVDTSRTRARRWCSMSTCGALLKKRSYRARRRGGSDGA